MIGPLSGMYRRAIRLGFATSNPVRGVAKFKENNARVIYLTSHEETAIHDVLSLGLRPLFVVSVNTGLRWSEQLALRWRDIDVLAAVITIQRSKNGHARRVPINSVVRSVLLGLAAQRQRASLSSHR